MSDPTPVVVDETPTVAVTTDIASAAALAAAEAVAARDAAAAVLTGAAPKLNPVLRGTVEVANADDATNFIRVTVDTFGNVAVAGETGSGLLTLDQVGKLVLAGGLSTYAPGVGNIATLMPTATEARLVADASSAATNMDVRLVPKGAGVARTTAPGAADNSDAIVTSAWVKAAILAALG